MKPMAAAKSSKPASGGAAAVMVDEETVFLPEQVAGPVSPVSLSYINRLSMLLAMFSWCCPSLALAFCAVKVAAAVEESSVAEEPAPQVELVASSGKLDAAFSGACYLLCSYRYNYVRVMQSCQGRITLTAVLRFTAWRGCMDGWWAVSMQH